MKRVGISSSSTKREKVGKDIEALTEPFVHRDDDNTVTADHLLILMKDVSNDIDTTSLMFCFS